MHDLGYNFFNIGRLTYAELDNLVDAWIEAEENLGLKNSLFFWDNGTTTQWVDNEEAEAFFKKTKTMNFDKVMDDYFNALEKKDKIRIFECLCIFNEIDEHPEIANPDILRRLKRLREATHHEIYKIGEEDLKGLLQND